MTIADVLESKREEILERWAKAVGQALQQHHLQRPRLLGSIPEVLDELAAALREFESKSADGDFRFVSRVADTHAAQRIDLGLDVSQLVREYGVLRDCVLTMLDQSGGGIHMSELLLFCRGIDAGAMRAVAHYVTLRDTLEARALGNADAGHESAAAALSSVRRAEAALRESEAQFRLLVDSVQDYGMFMLSVDGRVSGWNPGAHRLKGYEAEEIIGAPVSRFFTPEAEAERVPERLLQRATSEERAHYEGWMVRKDGTRFWATLGLYAVHDEDGRLTGFSNVARDNTRKKQLEESQRFLSTGAQSLAASLDFSTTLETLAKLATASLADWCAIFVVTDSVDSVVVSHADPAQQSVLAEAVTRLPSNAAASRGVGKVLRTGQSDLCNDTEEADWVRDALGVETPLQLEALGARSFICVPVAMREKLYAVMALVSTQPHRRYGDADLAFAEELARRGAVAIENARLYRESQEAIRAREEFISMASHDLRTPLASVKMLVQKTLRQAQRSAGSEIPAEDVAQPLERIDTQVGRLVRMMDALLDVTTISAGRMKLDLSDVDLAEVVRDGAARAADELQDAGCELRLHVDGPVLGKWDRLRIEQVLANLLANAAKYAGGRPIDVTVSADGPVARLSVKDHGIGIAQSDQARLFERFERVRPNGDIGGFGVGLWIVGRIVEAHGGRIHIDSREGEGAALTVELLRAPAATVADDSQAPSLH